MSVSLDFEALSRSARALGAQARGISALVKALKDGSSRKVESALSKLEKAEPLSEAAREALGLARAWLDEAARTRRQQFSAELKAACAAGSIEILVLGRDPLHLRLPPLSVWVDFAKDKAEIRFAEEVLAACPAQASAVLVARDKALRALERGAWNPTEYLERLRVAWMRAGKGDGDWVEITDILPELALLMQGRKFRRNPAARNYDPYTRARFAYDLHRLRRDRVLSSGPWRLTLGPATGGSTRDKGRVLLLEDAQGSGQYHLTLRFLNEGVHGT
jgi:hypothetical protein